MKKTFLILMFIFSFLTIYLTPRNKYEWMEEEIERLPEDGNIYFYRLIAIFPVMLYSILMFSLKRKNEKIFFFISCLLLISFWISKFFLS